MAIVVEDGSIVTGANAYCDVSYVAAYAAARGLNFAGSAGDKEAAIIKATDYIDARYSFNGARQSASQELSWPRTGASDASEGITISDSTIPSILKRAVAELATKAFGGTTLNEDLARGGRVTQETVGDISVSYESGDGVDVGTKFGITGLIKGLLRETTNDPVPWSASEVDGAYFTRGQFDNEGS